MNKEQLIKSLEKQEFKKFQFTIFKLENGKYTYCTKGSYPQHYMEMIYITDRYTTIESLKEFLNF